MPAAWFGRFHSPIPIRCRGALHFYSARDKESDELVVVVMAPRLPDSDARARLANLARVHDLVANDHVPRIACDGSNEETPWVALACDAVADAENLADYIRQTGERLEFSLAACLGKTMMETLDRVHQNEDPETHAPACLGSVSAGNLLFSPSGKLWLVGFGAGPLGGGCIAPEVSIGVPATPGADVYAFVLFLRSQAELIDMPNVLRRAIAGDALGNAKLLMLFLWSNVQILAGPVDARPSMADTLSQARKLWHELGFEPDQNAFDAWVARAIGAEPEKITDGDTTDDAPRLVVALDAAWIEMPNRTRYTLRARRPLRRLLLALANAHRHRDGRAVSVDELLSVGWPGESPLPEAGSNRVYVAISTLRKMGLGDVLQRWDGGYRIDPSVECQFVPS